jgi:hypothetical protein
MARQLLGPEFKDRAEEAFRGLKPLLHSSFQRVLNLLAQKLLFGRRQA